MSGAIDSHQVYKDGEIASKRFSVVIWLAHTEPTAFHYTLYTIQNSLFKIHHSSLRERRLAQHSFDHVRVLDSGEALIETLERESEAFVINAKAMEHGGIKIADVRGVLNDVVAEVIGLAVGRASFNTATGHPHTKAAAVVVPATSEGSLTVGGAAKLATPDNEGIV